VVCTCLLLKVLLTDSDVRMVHKSTVCHCQQAIGNVWYKRQQHVTVNRQCLVHKTTACHCQQATGNVWYTRQQHVTVNMQLAMSGTQDNNVSLSTGNWQCLVHKTTVCHCHCQQATGNVWYKRQQCVTVNRQLAMFGTQDNSVSLSTGNWQCLVHKTTACHCHCQQATGSVWYTRQQHVTVNRQLAMFGTQDNSMSLSTGNWQCVVHKTTVSLSTGNWQCLAHKTTACQCQKATGSVWYTRQQHVTVTVNRQCLYYIKSKYCFVEHKRLFY
jgi:hypothetical protein